MADTSESTARLAKFYGALSPSLESILSILLTAGIDANHMKASDLYERDLDCHNLGMHQMLYLLASVASEYASLSADDVVLDLGCGLGGPGRFLIDQFGCSIVGVDLLPLRIELAQSLAELTHTNDRANYRVADATALDFDTASFAQVWMLDVGIHIRNKHALFGEIARVLVPGGLLVMHEQTGPLPNANIFPAKRQAPYIAPSLPQLIRYVESAGLRMLTWRDTSDRVIDYFQGIVTMLTSGSEPAANALDSDVRDTGTAILNGYIEALTNHGGRTGVLVATRMTRR
jgi:SAM-dependent methyltransferase